MAPKDRVTNDMFIDDLTEFLTTLLPHHPNNIIMVDFNIHIEDLNDTNAMIVNGTMLALGLNQHVQQATHRLGNKFDLIFTETSDTLQVTDCVVGSFISNHRLVYTTFNIRKPPIEKNL